MEFSLHYRFGHFFSRKSRQKQRIEDRKRHLSHVCVLMESPSNQVNGNVPKLSFSSCSLHSLRSKVEPTRRQDNRFHHILWLINHRARIVVPTMMMMIVNNYLNVRARAIENFQLLFFFRQKAKTATVNGGGNMCRNERKRDKRDHSSRTTWNFFLFLSEKRKRKIGKIKFHF